MKDQTITVIGTKADVERLRDDLVKDAVSQKATVSAASAAEGKAGSDRVRDHGITEVIVSFLVHIPAGVAAHALYDWVKNYVRNRGLDDKVRVVASDGKDTAERKGGA